MNPYNKPIGPILKEARTAKGYSYDDVYEQIRVHPRILHALEEGTYVDLNPIYLKSYVRMYGQFLGVDQRELERFCSQPVRRSHVRFDVSNRAAAHAGSAAPSVQKNPISLLTGKNIVVCIVVFVVFFTFIAIVRKMKAPQHPRETVATTTKQMAAAVIPKRKVTKTAPDKKAAKKPAPKTSSSKTIAVAQGVSDSLLLTIYAVEDTWMQIKADGDVVFKRILKAKTSETWSTQKRFDLWLANAGTIKLELNGKILPAIGRRGQLLKNVVITKDGITVQR